MVSKLNLFSICRNCQKDFDAIVDKMLKKQLRKNTINEMDLCRIIKFAAGLKMIKMLRSNNKNAKKIYSVNIFGYNFSEVD